LFQLSIYRAKAGVFINMLEILAVFARAGRHDRGADAVLQHDVRVPVRAGIFFLRCIDKDVVAFLQRCCIFIFDARQQYGEFVYVNFYIASLPNKQ
jgi:hypothetical protein